ncbi:restriction endonuclease S subunit [Mycobacteroides abscessus subsp. abscessus]|uniref:restriction endonuclease subunit S n=1 Tax=Mycobacteroides abscessus TaxID=36809 RepID=UPI000926EA1E|nr:restriction endonuclease subunit S [Mycobacteroides abscessus]SHR98416.1 restriction endonuclease S subunit [Mycobacteroides abscessus subsp. abscessus]
MNALAAYPAYRVHDRVTFDELPNHWDVVRGRHLVQIRTGSGDTVDAVPDGDYPFYVRSDQPLLSDRWEFDTTAVLTAGDGAGVAKVFHLVSGRFMAHQRVYVLDDFRRVTPKFFFYAFSSMFRLMALDGSARSTVDSVRRPMIADLPFPVPPIDEQRAISDFLNRETARIDTLIEEQQRLIAMLGVRKRAVLDEVTAVASGTRVRLKYLFAPSSEANHPDEEVLSVYRDYGVIPKSSRDDNFNRTPENVARYLFVRPGDVVINRMKAWQGSLGVSEYRGIVSGDYEVVRPVDNRLLPRFAHLFLRSPLMIADYAVRSTGIRPSQWRLYWDQMGNIEVPVPPLAEQASIVEHIDEQTSKIDTLIAETERFIELARERRSALITAAVTGQIDVRAEVA